MNDKRNDFRRLRAEYDLAFRRWEDEVRSLDLLASQPNADSKAVEQKQRLVEEAQNAYRESRNSLAQFLVGALGISSDHPFAAPAAAVESDVTAGVGRLRQRLGAARENTTLNEDCARVEQVVG